LYWNVAQNIYAEEERTQKEEEEVQCRKISSFSSPVFAYFLQKILQQIFPHSLVFSLHTLLPIERCLAETTPSLTLLTLDFRILIWEKRECG
jgi:uncharacterized membrane protein